MQRERERVPIYKIHYASSHIPLLLPTAFLSDLHNTKKTSPFWFPSMANSPPSSSSFFILSYFLLLTLLLLHAPLQVTSSRQRRRRHLGSTSPSQAPTTAVCSFPANDSTRQHPRWIGPVGHRLITVNVNGSADFKSVQDAVDSVPENNRKNVTIRISAGYYM